MSSIYVVLYLHICINVKEGLVVQKTYLGWPVRRATVDRQVYLCAGNGAMNWQPPRGLHPEPTRSTTAASPGHQISACSIAVSSASSSACADVEGRNWPSARQTLSADSPIPLFSTSSRAIAVSMSSSPSMACRPSEANLPSIANATSSFLPIKRRQTSCIVPA